MEFMEKKVLTYVALARSKPLMYVATCVMCLSMEYDNFCITIKLRISSLAGSIYVYRGSTIIFTLV